MSMSVSAEGWKKFIQLIKERPIIYKNNTSMSAKEYRAAVAIAWDEVVADLNMTHRTCIKLWNKTRFRYAMLQILIHSDTLSKEVVMSNPETSRFLDGNLSFLDPYISKLTDANIPFSIKNEINDIFGLNTSSSHVQNKYIHNITMVTHEQVKALLEVRKEEEDDLDNMDMQHSTLHKVVASVIEQKLKELLPDTNTAPNMIILDQIINNINREKEMRDRTSLGLESELIIADDIIKTEKDDAKKDNLTIENNINEMKDIVDINNAIEQILPDSNINRTVVDDTINNTIIVRVSNVDATVIEDNAENINTLTESEISNVLIGVSDNNMRKFFNELGEVMSMELTIEKQKILKLRINSLVRNVLEDM